MALTDTTNRAVRDFVVDILGDGAISVKELAVMAAFAGHSRDDVIAALQHLLGQRQLRSSREQLGDETIVGLR
jgi:hypothetical protein